MGKRVVLLAVLLLAVVVTGAEGAPAKIRYLGSASETSSWPLVFFYSDSLPRPKWMWLDVSGYAIRPSGTYTVNCRRDFSTRSIEFEIPSFGRYWARPTLAKAESCNLSATVSPDDDYQGQTITVSAYGGSKPKSKRKKRSR